MLAPIGDRIAIVPPQERKTDGGIIIAESTKSVTRRGVVAAVGPEVKWVKVGDVVYYDGRPQMLPVVSDDVGYLVVREVEVFAAEQPPAPVDGRCPACGRDCSADAPGDHRRADCDRTAAEAKRRIVEACA